MPSMNAVLQILEAYGPTEPTTLLGPVRQGVGKFGDGLFVEEGTTNLVTNPGPYATNTGYGGANGTTIGPPSTVFGVTPMLPINLAVGGVQNVGTSIPYASIAVSTTYTVACQVWVPVGAPPMRLVPQGAGVASIASNPPSTATGQLVTLTATFTTTAGANTGNVTLYLLNDAATTAVVTVYARQFQFEAKAYRTSYADGSLGTPWNGTGNLLPTAAQDFEDGTVGGWSPQTGVTIANSSAQARVGTKSLAHTVTASPLGANQPLDFAAPVTIVPGKTYSFPVWVRCATGYNFAARIQWNNGGGFISVVDGASTAVPANTWTLVMVTGVAPSNATVAYPIVMAVSSLPNATVVYTDTIRFSEGSDAASYRWTGAENASTSVRTAGRLVHAAPLAGGPVSIALWVRMGTVTLARALLDLSDAGANNQYLLRNNSGFLRVDKSVGGAAVNASLGSSTVAGDLALVVFTVDGTTGTLYASINGGAVVSSTTSTGTTASGLASLAIGGPAYGADPTANDVVEQVLVLNAALTASEVAALAFAGTETTFKDDPRIVFAAGTGIVRGTTQAATTAGTGRYRAARTLTAAVEKIDTTGASPDDDTATYKVTVPAGSGVGQGQLVAFDDRGRYTVQRVFSPGGVYDELYLAAA